MNIEDLQSSIRQFVDERDWGQFHNPKDLAISLSLEASEVLEHFQWKNAEESGEHIISNKVAVAEELADVLYWVLLMSNDLDIDIEDAFYKKMLKNANKYPTEKAKGSHKKYTEIEK